MTGVSPERAAYEADPWAAPDISWEELFSEDKEKYRGISQAAIKASPELAEARAVINGLRALVAEIVGEVELGTLGQHTPAATTRTLARTAAWRKRAQPKEGTPVERDH